ncbi:putative cryptochrome/DNA photolyase class 1, cryptochrome/DNA photolyase, FAD-binding protein [Septoria linicola]|nr:putative cryptochrome/DNA photolyase class 1, cryptochrome/DNA photolyase, FAD-binding protein [Septoria linicola]
MPGLQRVLVYLLRRDLRLADNPIFNEVARLNEQSQKPFTHILPVYVFAAEQVEVSGFLSSDQEKSPYKEARSRVGKFWRCGSHRVTFAAESVWDLKQDLKQIDSDLVVRVGSVKDAVRSILDGYRGRDDAEIHGLWMTSEEGWEEQNEEKAVKAMLEKDDKEFKLWTDEKYYVDDRDIPFKEPRELPDVFTSYRKMVEPLRDAPRKELPKPQKLLPLPDHIPEQAAPFKIPSTYDEVLAALVKPLGKQPYDLPEPPKPNDSAKSAHPFKGGSKAGHERIRHLIDSGSMTSYKDTRNGLLGLDFSTKLSAWLALGCVSSRQVHWQLLDFENGKGECGKSANGYGKGENKGTAAVRFELLWRDYMRLCTRKFGQRLFWLDGYRGDTDATNNFISSPYTNSTNKKNKKGSNDEDTRNAVERFLAGRTGTGLIDASQRELWLTGWTSNRARQNVASYLSKHLGIDWRIGAEWYEQNLIDYDLSSNWGNWQYVAGVGNDPRGDARVFNPVKQAVDYDTNGEYVRTWVPELRDVGRGGQHSSGGDSPESLMGVFQAWRMPDDEKKRLGLEGVEWVEKPLIRIDYSVNRRGGGRGRGRGRGRGGRGRGDRGRGGQ